MSSEEPEITPAEEQEVSRLLALAAAADPLPADVAARLDDTLAGLVAERSTAPDEDGADDSGDRAVVPLRARRRWPRALLAAAAVMVVGYGVGGVLGGGSLSGGDTGDAASAGDTVAEDAAGGAEDASPERLGEAPAQELGNARDQAMVFEGVVRLRSERLAADVRRALGLVETSALDDLSSSDQSRCPIPTLSPGESALAARYDGRRTVLVTGPEEGGRVKASVYSCSGALLDETTVTLP